MTEREKDLFQRSLLLLGPQAMQRLYCTRVIVLGVGGVGSWCAESLLRCGIHSLTLVDSDCVCSSNCNRQLVATTADFSTLSPATVGEQLTATIEQRESGAYVR